MCSSVWALPEGRKEGGREGKGRRGKERGEGPRLQTIGSRAQMDENGSGGSKSVADYIYCPHARPIYCMDAVDEGKVCRESSWPEALVGDQ